MFPFESINVLNQGLSYWDCWLLVLKRKYCRIKETSLEQWSTPKIFFCTEVHDLRFLLKVCKFLLELYVRCLFWKSAVGYWMVTTVSLKLIIYSRQVKRSTVQTLLVISQLHLRPSSPFTAPQWRPILPLEVRTYHQYQILSHLRNITNSKISVYFYISWLYKG